ncbi:MAG: LptF/LptG family permease [Anaeromyxobacter sp.]
MILGRYVAMRTLWATLAALLGVVAIFVAVDYVDNAGSFKGPGWVPAVLELYANFALVVSRQVAPAAMLLGAGLAASSFRQTREYVAMRALGLGPWRLAVPAIAVVLLCGGVLVVLHEVVGVRAEDRAETIRALRFGRGGDRRRYEAAREPKRWFRGRDGRHVYHLRGALPGGGFEHITVLELDPELHLVRRIDAGHMRPEGKDWVLSDVEDWTFLPDGTLRYRQAAEARYRFDEAPEAFAVIPGRPSQMPWNTLLAQIKLRRRLGLEVAAFELERYNRLAYPFSGVPGALLAIALALRAARKGHMAAALVEGVGVSLLFWAMQGVTWALGLSGTVHPWIAAWLPNLVFVAAGLWAVQRAR